MQEDKLTGRYLPVASLSSESSAPQEFGWKKLIFPFCFAGRFAGRSLQTETAAKGFFLVTSNPTLNGYDIQTIYHKRREVEEYPKSVKINARFAKSPTETVRTQSIHIFACLRASVNWERLRLKTTLNHFAMKGRLYQAALACAYRELQVLKGGRLSA